MSLGDSLRIGKRDLPAFDCPPEMILLEEIDEILEDKLEEERPEMTSSDVEQQPEMDSSEIEDPPLRNLEKRSLLDKTMRLG